LLEMMFAFPTRRSRTTLRSDNALDFITTNFEVKKIGANALTRCPC